MVGTSLYLLAEYRSIDIDLCQFLTPIYERYTDSFILYRKKFACFSNYLQ